ncbi:MAG: YbaK/EbsC family protein [Bacilli bacterium]|nr:YbaK/EbsC family protein [Bacilli bacterium]MDD4547190.1 YbaK/EbsC family protein [Bacilli bacterium]
MANKHVLKFLKDNNYKTDIVTLNDSSTVLKAANELNVTTNEIAKTLAFILKDNIIVVVMSGDSKINNKKYKDYFKEKASMVPADKVETLTNHPIGGVCPFGLKENVKIYLDNSLKQLEYVYPAAGDFNLALKISVNDLERITKGTWIDVTTCNEVIKQ